MRRTHYEEAPKEFPGAYRNRDYDGVAWRVIGWETEPDEDTEWSGIEERTGRVVAHMIGDDALFIFDEEDIEPLERKDYCEECGQIGCHHDGYVED